jgi:uncharacterized membrane protein (DUF485 family)
MSTVGSEALHARRWRVALALTAAVIVVYFGFILLIAYAKEFMARPLTSGLTVGILFGAMVIVISWLLTWVYVRWANGTYDTAMKKLRGEQADR